MSDYKSVAVEFLDRAKEEAGSPAANTLALVGIGNALLEIADQCQYIVDQYQMDAIIEALGTIASNPARRPQSSWPNLG
jgi:hypothetical protein